MSSGGLHELRRVIDAEMVQGSRCLLSELLPFFRFASSYHCHLHLLKSCLAFTRDRMAQLDLH